MFILSLDLALIGYCIVLNAFMYWLKKLVDTSKWIIPLTAISWLVGCIIGIGWGFYLEGFSVNSILHYGLINGLCIGAVSVNFYDIVHGFTQKASIFSELWVKITSVFKKKEKKEGENAEA